VNGNNGLTIVGSAASAEGRDLEKSPGEEVGRIHQPVLIKRELTRGVTASGKRRYKKENSGRKGLEKDHNLRIARITGISTTRELSSCIW